MPVTITFNYPAELLRNATIRRAIFNAAEFVRDLWLARSPYATGDYAKGLRSANSIRIGNGKIEITNMSKHAASIEHGFRSYNIGLAMLNSGKGVRTSADGNRYKLIHVDPKPRGATRAPGVSRAVVTSFTKTMPIGMAIPRFDRYGAIKPYKQRRSLQRPLKGKAPFAGAMKGFFVISEKAIKADPSKWQMPSREGRLLGRKVMQESKPLIAEAIRAAVKGEKARQERMKGRTPKWYKPRMTQNILKAIPPGKERR